MQLCACETPDQTAIRTQCGPSATAHASRTLFSKNFDFSGDCYACCPESVVCCLFRANDAVLPLIPECNAAGGDGNPYGFGPAPPYPKNDQFRCKPGYNCTIPCANNQYSVPGSKTCTDCPKKPCKGLALPKSNVLKGSTPLISSSFEHYFDGLISCAKAQKIKLSVTSASRCGVPRKDKSPQAVDNSRHRIGNAVDVQPVLGDKLMPVTKADMASAWCAFNMNTVIQVIKGGKLQKINPCKLKFKNNRPDPKSPQNLAVYKFLKCAKDIRGLQVGASFPNQDANHFQVGPASNPSTRSAFRQLLQKSCKGDCPGINKNDLKGCICQCDVC